MSVPLVQNNDKDSINTSIIAIKRSLERINTLLGLTDNGSEGQTDTSEFVKKSEVVDAVVSDNMNPVTSNAVATSNAMPVDTVTSGNMHSVTSNAVAGAFVHKIDEYVRNDNFTATSTAWRGCCFIFPKTGTYLAEIFKDKNATTNIQVNAGGTLVNYSTIGTDNIRYAVIPVTAGQDVRVAVNATNGVTYDITLKLTQISYN